MFLRFTHYKLKLIVSSFLFYQNRARIESTNRFMHNMKMLILVTHLSFLISEKARFPGTLERELTLM